MSMYRFLLPVLGFLSGLQAQDISGVWQGTLDLPTGKSEVLLRIQKKENFWAASISPNSGYPVNFALEGNIVRIGFGSGALGRPASFEGQLSADGKAITGTITQGATNPITFQRITNTSPHSIQFVTVAQDVELEVLDWGGSGRPVVLLAGLTDTAHTFDALAGKLTKSYRVYGITRRGFGLSSIPLSGYQSDQRGDDVLKVMDSLKLNRPILIGHSVAGSELSSIGSRHPEKVAGLVYLDAGYPYAFYDPTFAPEFFAANPGPPPQAAQSMRAIVEGGQNYTHIDAPALAIFASGASPRDLEGAAAMRARAADIFEKGVPVARVVRYPKPEHYFYRSDEEFVIREIAAFAVTLQ